MYTPLYVKTNYSLLSSLITIDKLIAYCLKNHFTSIAITDNNMFGMMEFYKKCKKNNLKPIIGLELSLENGKVEEYEIEIEKIYKENNYDNKSMLIKVTDERLLEKTGGIIQRYEWVTDYSKWKIYWSGNTCTC